MCQWCSDVAEAYQIWDSMQQPGPPPGVAGAHQRGRPSAADAAKSRAEDFSFGFPAVRDISRAYISFATSIHETFRLIVGVGLSASILCQHGWGHGI